MPIVRSFLFRCCWVLSSIVILLQQRIRIVFPAGGRILFYSPELSRSCSAFAWSQIAKFKQIVNYCVSTFHSLVHSVADISLFRLRKPSADFPMNGSEVLLFHLSYCAAHNKGTESFSSCPPSMDGWISEADTGLFCCLWLLERRHHPENSPPENEFITEFSPCCRSLSFPWLLLGLFILESKTQKSNGLSKEIFLNPKKTRKIAADQKFRKLLIDIRILRENIIIVNKL